MRPSSVLLAALCGGCVSVEQSFDLEPIPADGASAVFARIDSGHLTLRGSEGATSFTGEGQSRGFGSTRAKATRRAEANGWSVRAETGALHVDAWSKTSHAGVDFWIDGPSALDTELYTDGTVELVDLYGYHFVDASRFESTRLIGDVEAHATGGMDAEIWPFEGGRVYLQADGGDVALRLPYGYDYDLQVWGDPEEAMEIADLGFTAEYFGEGYFAGSRGGGSIQVTVYVTDGSFSLLESR